MSFIVDGRDDETMEVRFLCRNQLCPYASYLLFKVRIITQILLILNHLTISLFKIRT